MYQTAEPRRIITQGKKPDFKIRSGKADKLNIVKSGGKWEGGYLLVSEVI